MDYNTVFNSIKQSLITDLGCDNFESKPEKGTIAFEYKQLHYYCVYTQQDPSYMRILLPRIDSIREGMTPEVYQKMLEFNASYKVAKITLMNNESLWIAAEIFLTGTTNLSETIVRIVNLLYGMRNEYSQYINNVIQPAQ